LKSTLDKEVKTTLKIGLKFSVAKKERAFLK
jgi:hypothetical protein